jgi:hypothetical protein
MRLSCWSEIRPSRWLAKLRDVSFPFSGIRVKTYELVNPYEWSLTLVVTHVDGKLEEVTVHSTRGSFTFVREYAEEFLRFVNAWLLEKEVEL